MKPNYAKQIKAFLQSTEATASAFSSIGWDETKRQGTRDYWCLVQYGILEEMEIDVVLDKDGNWYAEMYIPPILPRYEEEAAALCATLQQAHSPLLATVDVDNAILLGVMGEGDPMPKLKAFWQAFAEEEIYQSVLFLCGLTAPTKEDMVSFDYPDPFDDEE